MTFPHRHILSTRQLTANDVHTILDKARGYRAFFSTERVCEDLRGVVVTNTFFESSTRTRSSFETAAKRLGAHVIDFQSQSSSISKGESLKDTLLTLDAMSPDVIVMRHSMSGAAEYAAGLVEARVMNAGDGMHEHPTQALLDFLTLTDVCTVSTPLNVGIVGDLLHSRVFRSNLRLLSTMGATVHVCGPATLIPREVDVFGVVRHPDLTSLLANVDAVMMLRLQNERMNGGLLPRGGEYRKRFGLTMDHLRAFPRLQVLHPGPANYGWEIDEEVTLDPRCHMRTQVSNGVYVRMACMALTVNGS
ncbi:MAG: aspartate carbamoyltransferase catalytic subunit [Candidatus Kapaibacterium sp.]